MRMIAVHALVLGLGISLYLASSNRAMATVLSGRIEGTCQIEALEVCKLSFTSDISHDEATPIVAARVLTNGVVLYEYRNDAINPFTDLGIPGRTLSGGGALAARCGQTYTLELQAQASDDLDFKSVATTRGIPCPLTVP